MGERWVRGKDGGKEGGVVKKKGRASERETKTCIQGCRGGGRVCTENPQRESVWRGRG